MIYLLTMKYSIFYIPKEELRISGGVIISKKLRITTNIEVNGKFEIFFIYLLNRLKNSKGFEGLGEIKF